MENIPDNPAGGDLGPRHTLQTRTGRVLSPARAAVLEALRDADRAATVGDLEAMTGLHANTLREHLEALVARGLVARVRATPSGRGRPAWLYEAVQPVLDPAASEYAGLAATLAAHLHHTSVDPQADAVRAGRPWGHDLARRAGAPDGSESVDARRKVLAVLESLGFAPEADEQATTARLTRCPLLETAKTYPDVVCGVHLGIVRGALDAYGEDSSRTTLVPFAEPGACLLHLLPQGER